MRQRLVNARIPEPKAVVEQDSPSQAHRPVRI